MRKRKIKKLWKIGLAVLVVLLILDSYLLYDSRIFNINTVDVKLDKIGCANGNDIERESQVLGQKFLFIDSKKPEQKLKDKFVCIKSVNISRTFPDKVKIDVSGRQAVAILALLTPESTLSATLENPASQSASSDSIGASISAHEKVKDEFLVDGEGVVFLKGHQENLAVIYFWGSPLDVGKNLGEGLVQSTLKILEKIKTFGVETKEAKIYSQDVLLLNLVTQKPRIIFALDKNIDAQLASLQLIMTQAKINEEEMEFIDLRFDKLIIKLIPKKGESSH